MFENFSDLTLQALFLAATEARRLGREAIHTEHVLLGLLRSGKGTACEALRAQGVTLRTARTETERQAGRGRSRLGWGPFGWGAEFPFNEDVRQSFDLAASAVSTGKVQSEHLLLGLVGIDENGASRVLAGLGVDLEDFRGRLERLSQLDAGA
ncbi:MAG: hypothetical protein H7Y22_16185 [Gemmatimonadaceae bacterium]|nr:hypothetical protein [Gloeobacterales cyanobacterium ES-bin-141]